MRIVVMSDTHGETNSIDQVRHAVGPVDAVFHCGDSELDIQHESLQDAFVVEGNCDWDSSYSAEVFTEVNGVKVFMTHGHLWQVKSTLMPLSTRAQELGADLVLFGHTHLLGAELIGSTLFVNPGSLELPRGRKEKSYAIIEKSQLKWMVTFFSDAHKQLEQQVFSIV
ncbi:metallophosphoesterase [Paenisporosarcina antarctica]|uniref:Phosphoesterase n=1 Tax=Paenisporosarcina antarctica TaxID=417367 RepID=A0A4P6ZWW1_9BACL|nr:metallophosphoesterase [Paenisporosarcina antarctica]QBP40734.1 metallophosphoesterase [Paenisporosarcina antarctica]